MSNININQDMIRKIAEGLAKGKVEDAFTCNTGNEKKTYEKDYTTSRNQINMATENMKTILSRSQTVTCEKCNNYTFLQVVVVKRISPIISPSGEEVMVPMQALSCIKCDHVNEQFLPSEAISDILKKEEKPKPKRKRKTTAKKKT